MITPFDILEIALSAGVFIFLWNYLGKGIFAPFFALLEEREAKTQGSEDAAKSKKDEVRSLQQELERRQQEARLQGLARRDELVQRAKSEAQSTLMAASERSAQFLQRSREELAALKASTETTLEPEIDHLADELVQKLLDRGAAPTVH